MSNICIDVLCYNFIWAKFLINWILLLYLSLYFCTEGHCLKWAQGQLVIQSPLLHNPFTKMGDFLFSERNGWNARLSYMGMGCVNRFLQRQQPFCCEVSIYRLCKLILKKTALAASLCRSALPAICGLLSVLAINESTCRRRWGGWRRSPCVRSGRQGTTVPRCRPLLMGGVMVKI